MKSCCLIPAACSRAEKRGLELILGLISSSEKNRMTSSSILSAQSIYQRRRSFQKLLQDLAIWETWWCCPEAIWRGKG
ncbi:hypothetical protein LEMLEM_LOCUS13450 [Lemmus lemmus]